MAVGHNGAQQRAGKLLLPVLLCAVVISLLGCTGNGAGGAASTVAGPATSDPTEAALLAELDRKFENPQAHYELARLYHKSQNWTRAEYRYNQALSFEPANKPAQAGLVKMYIDRGEPASGEQFANSYLRQAANSVNESLKLAAEFQKVGLDDYAFRGLRQALEVGPDSFEANKQMGLYYLSKKDSAKAKQYLVRSFELNPRQPDVAMELGRLGVVVELPKGTDEQAAPKQETKSQS
jgi:tetratricopeptide (TPR) repeat protein